MLVISVVIKGEGLILRLRCGLWGLSARTK